jgi:hypothetical protein
MGMQTRSFLIRTTAVQNAKLKTVAELNAWFRQNTDSEFIRVVDFQDENVYGALQGMYAWFNTSDAVKKLLTAGNVPVYLRGVNSLEKLVVNHIWQKNLKSVAKLLGISLSSSEINGSRILALGPKSLKQLVSLASIALSELEMLDDNYKLWQVGFLRFTDRVGAMMFLKTIAGLPCDGKWVFWAEVN